MKKPIVERNDIYFMLGHKLRVTAVKPTHIFHEGERERRVFLTCAKDCDCGQKFCDKLLWPVKLQILERHLHKVPLDKLGRTINELSRHESTRKTATI